MVTVRFAGGAFWERLRRKEAKAMPARASAASRTARAGLIQPFPAPLGASSSAPIDFRARSSSFAEAFGSTSLKTVLAFGRPVVIACLIPLGQRTSSLVIFVAGPRPKCAILSLPELVLVEPQ